MWLLPDRPDHVRLGAASGKCQANRCGHRCRDGGQHLPLRHVHPYPGGDSSSCRLTAGLTGQELRSASMYLRNIEDSLAAWPPLARLGITRRDFLRFTTIAGSGLTLGMIVPAVARNTGLTVLGVEGTPGDYSTPFVRIDPDNTVTVICKHVEAGQGVWTGLPAVVAEELDASWSQMRAESSPAKVPTYGNFAFGPKGNVQGTGGSTSMANSWDHVRHAGAYARAMLVQAA